jgi:2-oxoglutarate dehydrogenase E2 component (dihydrolipoamide succinyltransferase)
VQPAAAPQPAAQPAPPTGQERETARGTPHDADATEGERVTPVARRLAEAQAVDLAQVTPTGTSGRVNKRDVEIYLEQRQAGPAPAPDSAPVPEAAAPDPPAPAKGNQLEPGSPAAPADADGVRREERVRVSRRRRTIARRLVEAQQTAAMLTTFNEIDLGAVMDIRRRRKESFKEKHGIGLGFMSFFVKASLGALKAFPMLNAELQDDEIVLKHYYDIGVAIGAEEGLVVPVLRDADRLSFAEVEQSIEAYVQKVRGGTLSLDDLRGGTFTITNGGVFGSLLSTPILNPPQVGILGLHKIEERPVARSGEVVIRSMMNVALTYDHRLVHGREAVQFLVRVKELIEDPETMLIEG